MELLPQDTVPFSLGCHAISFADLPEFQVSPRILIRQSWALGMWRDWDIQVFLDVAVSRIGSQTQIHFDSSKNPSSSWHSMTICWGFWASNMFQASHKPRGKENLQGILELEQRILGRNSPGKLELLGITRWRCDDGMGLSSWYHQYLIYINL